MYEVTRKFSPTTITFYSEGDLEQFKKMLFMAERATHSRWGLGDRDVQMSGYIERLIKAIK